MFILTPEQSFQTYGPITFRKSCKSEQGYPPPVIGKLKRSGVPKAFLRLTGSRFFNVPPAMNRLSTVVHGNSHLSPRGQGWRQLESLGSLDATRYSPFSLTYKAHRVISSNDVNALLSSNTHWKVFYYFLQVPVVFEILESWRHIADGVNTLARAKSDWHAHVWLKRTLFFPSTF